MKVQWLIEDDAFPEDTAPFVDAVKRQGMTCKIIKQIPCEVTEFLPLFGPDDCVVFYGSLGLAKKIRARANWVPGVYYDVPKYNCVTYYPALAKFLLQSNYIMLPFGDLIRQKEFLYEHLGSSRAVFMRPSRGDKIFTGQVVYKENYEKDIDLFGFHDIAPDEIVVTSEPINIAAEWRFVVVEGTIVAGSQYKENERYAPDPTYPQEALNFAYEVSKCYNPEAAWVIDVCLTKSGHYRLMEVGCFSCAGLYKCDRDAIVKAVSTVAIKEWKEMYEF